MNIVEQYFRIPLCYTICGHVSMRKQAHGWQILSIAKRSKTKRAVFAEKTALEKA